MHHTISDFYDYVLYKSTVDINGTQYCYPTLDFCHLMPVHSVAHSAMAQCLFISCTCIVLNWLDGSSCFFSSEDTFGESMVTCYGIQNKVICPSLAIRHTILA